MQVGMYATQVLRLGARQVNVHTAYSIDYIHKATEIYADCTINLQTKVFFNLFLIASLGLSSMSGTCLCAAA